MVCGLQHPTFVSFWSRVWLSGLQAYLPGRVHSCPGSQSSATHPETRRWPALLGHDAEFADAEAHVFADEFGYLHSSDKAVATVQHW